MVRAWKPASEFPHAMEVSHLLLHQLHQQLLQQLPGYIPYCLSSHIMELGHLHLHRQCEDEM